MTDFTLDERIRAAAIAIRRKMGWGDKGVSGDGYELARIALTAAQLPSLLAALDSTPTPAAVRNYDLLEACRVIEDRGLKVVNADAVALMESISGLTRYAGGIADALAAAWMNLATPDDTKGERRDLYGIIYVGEDWAKMVRRMLRGYAEAHERPHHWPWQDAMFDGFAWRGVAALTPQPTSESENE